MSPVDGSTPTVHVDASPASCVNVALHHLCPDADLVISGPNIGHNCGRAAVLSSGTVGAALEGALAGRRAIAISFPFNGGWGNWPSDEVAAAVEAAARVTTELWEFWAEEAASGGSAAVQLYNVNVPIGGASRFSADAAGAVGQRVGGGGGGGGGGDGGAPSGVAATCAGAAAAVAEGSVAEVLRGGVARLPGGEQVVRTVVDGSATYGSLFGECDSATPRAWQARRR